MISRACRKPAGIIAVHSQVSGFVLGSNFLNPCNTGYYKI